MKILSFDVGGANTKKLLYLADKGEILKNEMHYFPFWKKWRVFPDFLSRIGESAERVGFVFTAELSDAFPSRRAGIEFLMEACSKFSKPKFMSVDKKLLGIEEVEDPLSLAAANFVASVYYMEGRFKEGILLDMGSTTTDIVPFRRGEKLYAQSDLERLLEGQLLYQGCLRTPLASLGFELQLRGRKVKPAAEHFAIAADVYNVLGELENYPCDTPDGRGKGREESEQRVARMLCSEPGELSRGEILGLCRGFKRAQVDSIASSLRKVAQKYGLARVFIAGKGHSIGMEACEKLGLRYENLRNFTSAHDNLPCLGLAEALANEGG